MMDIDDVLLELGVDDKILEVIQADFLMKVYELGYAFGGHQGYCCGYEDGLIAKDNSNEVE